LAQLHELKTGALFAAATAFGSLGAGFSGTVVDRAKDIGRGIGLGFQIVDDFIDLFGTSAERGRTGSSDAKNQKTTFFNNTEAGFGLGMLTDTRKRIQEMLDVFVRSIKREGAPLCETEAIIDSIFSRVAG
jgi:geranylgeranyl pyrophosphate synthase